MGHIETFLKDLTYGSHFRILDEGKDKDKLAEIAAKRGIVLPANDLAVFECVYAFVDKENKNKCTLPKEEVKASLSTLVGKSVDLDHFRKNVVGYWIDAKLVNDTIYAYGIIFKGSFKEDYDIVKELFDKGNLAVSFEAWGNRIMKDEESYNLTDIEFAGGALLIKSQPAFAGAGVLEMAKERVLEFASVMTEPVKYVHNVDEKINDVETVQSKILKKTKELGTQDLEESRYYIHDTQSIFAALSEVECLSCKEKNMMDVMMMDYSKSKANLKCVSCGAEMSTDLTPTSKLTKKGRKIKKMEDLVCKAETENLGDYIKQFDGDENRLSCILEESMSPYPKLSYTDRLELSDEDFAVVKNIEKGKLRIFPIRTLAQLNYAYLMLSNDKVIKMFEQLSIAKDSVDRKISRKVITIAMKELLEKFKKETNQEVIQEIAKASISRELTKEELEKAKVALVDLVGKKGTSNPQSLQTVKGPTTVSPTSVQTAEIEAIITEAIKVAEVVKPVENAEVVELKKQLDEATQKLAEATKKLNEINQAAEEAKKVAEKAEMDAKIVARKTELAEFAKDMKDEEILDDAKFELAKLKKENAELKAAKPVIAAKDDLTKGAADKDPESAEVISRNKVNELAYTRRQFKGTKE